MNRITCPFPIMVAPTHITVVIRGVSHTVCKDNPVFHEIRGILGSEPSEEDLLTLFDRAAAVQRFSEGKLTLHENGDVYFGDEKLENCVTRKIREFMSAGLPFAPLLAFLDKLLQNPSRRSIEQLYSFLEHRNMPITPDGDFLAYKSVRLDYTDWHTGTVDNHPGVSPPRKRRQDVDDDPQQACSTGYHVGSLQYANTFHLGGDRHLIIVKVNPVDVVAIPYDCYCQKMRCTFYKVVQEYQGPLPEVLVYGDNVYREVECATSWDDDEESGDLEELEYDSLEEVETCPDCGDDALLVVKSVSILICTNCQHEFHLDPNKHLVKV